MATNTVTVNGQTAYRKGEYFRKELPIANTSNPAWTNITVAATGQTSVSGYTFVPKTPEQFWYDLDGNLTNDGRWKYSWDAENRLVRLVSGTSVGPQQRIDFGYDTRGRRITKKVWNNTSGTGTPALDQRFVYDDWNLAAELNATNNAVIRSYIWGLDLSGSLQGAGGVGGLIAVMDVAGGTNFCAFDGNGNVSILVSATDAFVTATYEYGPFGELLRATGPMAKANPFRFSTKYQDDETDLLYYGRRFLDISAGRWLSRDPAGETAGRNLYGFVRNTLGVDRLGLAELHYIDHPKWSVISDWSHTALYKEFLWVGHYLTFDATDASRLSGGGVMLVNHRSSAKITDCTCSGILASPESENWFFASKFRLNSDGTVATLSDPDVFTDNQYHLFTQMGSFSMSGMHRRYSGLQGDYPTKGSLDSTLEVRIIPASNFEENGWDTSQPPGFDETNINGHELGRYHWGRMVGKTPGSWSTSSIYSKKISMHFEWDNCALVSGGGNVSWSFTIDPHLTGRGEQRMRYRDTQWPGVDLVLTPSR